MFFNIVHLEILSFFIYYHFMNLSNIKNRYSFNLLSLFGCINAILTFTAFLITHLMPFKDAWVYLFTLFCIFVFTLPVGYLLTIFTYIYEEPNKNFRIKNEKFLSNKFIFILQIMGVFLNLIPLALMTTLFIR